MRTQSTHKKTATSNWLSICAVLFMFTLTGCATTGNIDPKYDPSAHTNTGLLLFSVTHDKENTFGRGGANVYLSIHFRNIDTGDTILQAVSNDWGALIPTTPFDSVWGKLYVREFAAGRYELSTWSLHQNTGVGINSFTPNQQPSPITFEVRPGSVTYIGNVHGDLLWGKNIFGMNLVAGAIPQVKNEAERDVSMILKDYPQLNGRIVVAPIRTGSWWTDSQSAAGAQQFRPIPVPAPAYELNGFSVMPPTGERWMVKDGVTRTKVEFIRSTDVGPNHTVIAWAEIIDWQGSESSVKEIVRKITEPTGKDFMDQSRYANPQIDIVETQLAGMSCSEFSFSVQDRGVPYAQGKIFVIRGCEIYCLHPESPKPVLIQLAYSQRYLQGQQPLPIESELKMFRDGITVMPLPTSAIVVSSFPSAKQIYDSCVPVETNNALAGTDSRKPMNRSDASYYAHLLCSITADLCLKEPDSPACQSSLKSYKLLD